MKPISEAEAVEYLDPTKPQVEFRTVDVTSIAGLDEAEALCNEGWRTHRTGLLTVTLIREKEKA